MRTGGRVLIGIDGWDAAGKGGLIERMSAASSRNRSMSGASGAPTA